MKKNAFIVVAAACVLAVALAGCASGASSGSAAASSTASSSGSASASAAASPTASKSASSEAASAASASAQAGMANPWSDVASAQEAAAGAGLDGFDVPEDAITSLGDMRVWSYRCMDGIAEAVCEFPAVEMTIRKGTSAAAQDGDISGDYNEYAHSWTQNIKGLEVTCFGNREGDATKTIWTLGDTCYSITAYGLGGDTDFGLSADDLNSLINGLQ